MAPISRKSTILGLVGVAWVVATEGPSHPPSGHSPSLSLKPAPSQAPAMAQPSPLRSSEPRVLEKGPGSHQKQLQKNIGSQFCFHKSGPFRQGFEGWRTGSERGPASPTWPPLSGQHHHRAPYTMAQPSPLSSSEIKV